MEDVYGGKDSVICPRSNLALRAKRKIISNDLAYTLYFAISGAHHKGMLYMAVFDWGRQTHSTVTVILELNNTHKTKGTF